jgi:GTPase Era involved in 16S rRNA processing
MTRISAISGTTQKKLLQQVLHVLDESETNYMSNQSIIKDSESHKHTTLLILQKIQQSAQKIKFVSEYVLSLFRQLTQIPYRWCRQPMLKFDGPVLEVTVLCIGLVGSGKTRTIERLLDTSSFPPTRSTRISIVKAEKFCVKWTFIDTPGLYPASGEKPYNEDVLIKINAALKYKPDVCIYFDRMDHARRDAADTGVFKSIFDILGITILFNSLIVLTHAGNPPPEGVRYQLIYDHYLK